MSSFPVTPRVSAGLVPAVGMLGDKPPPYARQNSYLLRQPHNRAYHRVRKEIISGCLFRFDLRLMGRSFENWAVLTTYPGTFSAHIVNHQIDHSQTNRRNYYDLLPEDTH